MAIGKSLSPKPLVMRPERGGDCGEQTAMISQCRAACAAAQRLSREHPTAGRRLAERESLGPRRPLSVASPVAGLAPGSCAGTSLGSLRHSERSCPTAATHPPPAPRREGLPGPKLAGHPAPHAAGLAALSAARTWALAHPFPHHTAPPHEHPDPAADIPPEQRSRAAQTIGRPLFR